ncbi:nucleoside phosphorylase domain-containing protein [Usnea florida]
MRRQDYTVGLICALQTEFVAACELLDDEHPPLPAGSSHDGNAYTLGRIGDHYIVIACLPKGRYGIASAASVAKDMLRSFESIRIGLMVGIGGGAPSGKHDIRLGDIVVGCPINKEGGVVPYNFGKAVQDHEFQRTGSLNSPPTVLLTALTKLSADHERKGNHIAESVRLIMTKNPNLRRKYQHPGLEHDRLYDSSYTHRERDERCEICCDNTSPPLLRRLLREPEPDEPVVHYGLIASADKLMKDAIARDRMIEEHDILCFEMEAAGLMNDFPCVVIRGICDYSDSHKNDVWQGYAAVTAASYAKELLDIIPRYQVASTHTATAGMGE